MAIETFINGQENGVIAFSGNTEPCAVYVNGERQDNISYIPQDISGVNSVEYKSEYKRNIRTMRIDGNSTQPPTELNIPQTIPYFADPQITSMPGVPSETPIHVPTSPCTVSLSNFSGIYLDGVLQSDIEVVIAYTQEDIIEAASFQPLYMNGTLYEQTVTQDFYIGLLQEGIFTRLLDKWTFLQQNANLTLTFTAQTPTPTTPVPILNAGDSRLPIDYQEVEYIESTGTQYIDTGFYPNQDTRVVCDFQLTEITASFVFGGRNASAVTEPKTFTFNMGGGNPTKFVTTYGAGGQQIFGNADLLKHTVDKDKNKTTFDNTTLTETYSEFTSPKTLALFACNQASADGYLPSKVKLYSCQMYDNGTLIRNFIPCYRISDNKVGMYDLVNGVFYTNSGTGEFVKGANIGMFLELRGKNLLDIAKAKDLKSGVTHTIENNVITFKSTVVNGTFRYEIPVEIGKTYTVSVEKIETSATSPSYIPYLFVGNTPSADRGEYGNINGTTRLSLTFTATTSTLYIKGYVCYDKYGAEYHTKTIVKPMLTESADVQPFEPYFEPVTVGIPSSVTVGNSTIPLRFAKYKNADYLLVDRTNGTVKYYQYSTVGDPTKPLSEQAENNPPLEYALYDKSNNITTELGQAILDLVNSTQNQTNIITITSTPSVSKLSVNYAKYGGAQ